MPSNYTSAQLSLYNAIIKPLRDEDARGSLLLQRFLTGPQAVHDRTEALILSLFDQVLPDKVRADLLQYLKDIVGFTVELRDITSRLDEIQLRRLIALAVPLWSERHTEQGLISAIRLLTGRPAFVTTWFGYRNILGEEMLTEDQLAAGGDNWVIGGDVTTYDEYWSNVRVMDDGTLDEILLLDVIGLMRPMSERIEVFLDDFLDRFDGDLSRWTTVAGSDAAISSGAMVIPAGTEVQPIIPILPNETDHQNYNIVTKFKLADATSVFKTNFYIQIPGVTYYELAIKSGMGFTGQVTLTLVNSGTPGILYTINPHLVNIQPGTWYKLRVTVQTVGTHRFIRVYIDSNQVINDDGTDFDDGIAVIGFCGPYSFAADTNDVTIDNVESWRNPARFATVEISTLTERNGHVTMTSNFIQ